MNCRMTLIEKNRILEVYPEVNVYTKNGGYNFHHTKLLDTSLCIAKRKRWRKTFLV